jgi:transcriptional regulator with XRE-family HTH domain
MSTTEPFNRRIGELIERREHLGMSQRDLEERLGVSERMVAKWESRRRNPTALNLDRWARALGLKVALRKQ